MKASASSRAPTVQLAFEIAPSAEFPIVSEPENCSAAPGVLQAVRALYTANQAAAALAEVKERHSFPSGFELSFVMEGSGVQPQNDVLYKTERKRT